MLPSYAMLRDRISVMIADKESQGHRVDGLREELEKSADDYEQLAELGRRLEELPLRADWEYVEPSALDAIEREWSWDGTALQDADRGRAVERTGAAFLGRVVGCVLGKPVEIHTDLATLRDAFDRAGEWPIYDYVSERVVNEGGLERLHRSWPVSVRERISHVPPDDDLHYTIMAMLVLERSGVEFTHADLADLWVNMLPLRITFGPERGTLVKLGLGMLNSKLDPPDPSRLADTFNPGAELCGAMIRADAYGYASPGRPDLAARLAWRDASFTHRRTGIYGAMFSAAAIATSYVVDDPLDVVEHALKFVPGRSRFHHIVEDSLEEVARASDWEDGYQRIHGKYAEYTHCRVFQETGTLVNTLRFAESVGHGVCLQVMQANDTDSYGATAGSLLGIRFGREGLEERWLEPFNDTILTQLAGFHDTGLTALAERMGRLALVAPDAPADRA